MKNFITLLFTGIMGLFSFLFGQTDPNSVITTDDLKTRYGKDTNLVVLDVRTAAELSGELGKLPKVIHIPVQELSGRINELSKYKEKEIAVICRSGNRSRMATDILKKAGYNAKNVPGGMISYRK